MSSTNTTPRHRGAAMNIVPELDIRQVILVGLHELANDSAELEALVRRTDDLQEGSQLDWNEALAAELRAMLDPASDRYVFVKVGYPTHAAHLPCVSIVLEAANEDTGEAQMGDVLDIVYRKEGLREFDRGDGTIVKELPKLDKGTELTPLPLMARPIPLQRVFQETVLGGGWDSNIQVGCWAVAPETSLVLQAAVRWALYRNKGRLHDAGVHEVGFSEGGETPDERLEPRVGYVPMIRVHLDWTYRQTKRSTKQPVGVRILPGCPLN